MKRFLALLLCFSILCALCGCAPLGSEGIDIELEDDYSQLSEIPEEGPISSEKTGYNYLTGEYNLAQDRVGYRPYCISINNISASWPQYGISEADMIIEMETEGGITRMMALYTDARDVEKIGSVRSLRDQFIECVYPLDPIIIHIGTSIYADKAIVENNIRTFDGNEIPKIVQTDRVRMQSYSSEHCKFTNYDLITKTLADVDLDPKSTSSYTSYFNFTEVGTVVTPADGDAEIVKFRFSSNEYDGEFRYDSATKTYLKFQRGRAQMDAGVNKQLAFDNVLLLFANIQTVEFKAGLVHVDFESGGMGYYFSQGKYEEINWIKEDYSSLFKLTKQDGTDLVLNTGKTMLCVTRSTNFDTFSVA